MATASNPDITVAFAPYGAFARGATFPAFSASDAATADWIPAAE